MRSMCDGGRTNQRSPGLYERTSRKVNVIVCVKHVPDATADGHFELDKTTYETVH